MSRSRPWLYGALGLLASAFWLAPLPGRAYVIKPSPGHTGGFGEPTCQRCHWDQPLNDPGGSLRLTGLPRQYEPGERHEVTIRLERPGLRRAGFQMAARLLEGEGSGRQAGFLRAVDRRASVREAEATGIQYALHTEEGTLASAPGSASWIVEWTSPGTGAGPTVLHVAANASNDDDSEFGDFIYVRELVVEPAAGRR